jgi:hypothetical protein
MKRTILLLICLIIATINYKDNGLSLHDYSFLLLGFVGLYFMSFNVQAIMKD